MPSLPIRPWIFVSAYVGLFALAFALMVVDSTLMDDLMTPIQVTLMAFQVIWVWQALRFATSQLRLRGGDPRADLNHRIALALTACLLVGLIPFVIFLGFNGPFPETTSPPLAVAIGMPLGVLGTFGLYWIAARALVDAERAAGVGAPHVLGTAMQFLYLIFAAPFLYRRLEAVAAAPRETASQTI